MKMKTSELTDAALDWAVAKCEGNHITLEGGAESGSWEKYSTDWALCGPIIERECIDVEAHNAATSQPKNPEYWSACVYGVSEYFECTGPTPLIVAMRCYVASKLGDEVEVPDELKGETP